VVAEEGRPLTFVAEFGVGRREREALGETDTGARALVEVNEPPGDVANTDRRVVVDGPADMRVDTLVVDLQGTNGIDIGLFSSDETFPYFNYSFLVFHLMHLSWSIGRTNGRLSCLTVCLLFAKNV